MATLVQTSFDVSKRGIHFSRSTRRIDEAHVSPASDSRTSSESRDHQLGIRLYDVGLVRPLNCWKASMDEPPSEYVFLRPLLAEQTLDSACIFAEQFNGRVIVEDGSTPGSWAIVFAPGAMNQVAAA